MHARLLTLPHILGSTPDDLPNKVPYLSIDEKRIADFAQIVRPNPQGLPAHCPPPTAGSSNPHSEIRIPQSSPSSSNQRSAIRIQQSPASSLSPCLPVSLSALKVGLAWQGNTAHKGDRFRSIPLSLFAPLSQIEGVQLVSLQKGYGSEQIEQNKAMNLLEWSDPTDTTAEALVDTAAVMKNLDLVIAVDTSLAHLAGALSVPVWIAMPLAPDWRWLLEREDTPWYPTMRLFRQRKHNDWQDVIDRLTTALGSMIEHQPSIKDSRRSRNHLTNVST